MEANFATGAAKGFAFDKVRRGTDTEASGGKLALVWPVGEGFAYVAEAFLRDAHIPDGHGTVFAAVEGYFVGIYHEIIIYQEGVAFVDDGLSGIVEEGFRGRNLRSGLQGNRTKRKGQKGKDEPCAHRKVW